MLGASPPIVAVRALAGPGFAAVLQAGGRLAAPDVAVLRGPAPPRRIAAASPVDAVPGWAAGLGWGVLLLLMLGVAGGGWALAVVGPGASPEAVVSLAPAVGAGALVLGGFAAAEAGIRLGGGGGAVTVLLVGVLGYLTWWARRSRRAG